MEALLAHERAAGQHVLSLLKSKDVPVQAIADAFNTYRPICQGAIFADFQNVEQWETRLWLAHTEARKYFHVALKDLRKSDRPVETRVLVKEFLKFLKQSQQYYRDYIHTLSTLGIGIPELEVIARRVKGEELGESQQLTLPPELQQLAVDSCHRTLIYLGDLSRYRASEKLDTSPDFGPAIGFYDLAAFLKPSSGLGHHQQAVVALEQRNHLRAIYHLYRSIAVAEPHPHGEKNLKVEFEKTIAAWDKGELIRKGPPNHPDAPQHNLVGWFVRLHSMCFKGDQFRGYGELEREVLTQLSNVIKQRPLDHTLMRMVLVNIAAQHLAGIHFQANPSQILEDSFLHYFRFNVKTMATLLHIFYDDLRATLLDMDNQNVELDAKLTTISRRLLPCLRVYNNWLIPSVHLLEGLAADTTTGEAIQQLWPIYAKSVDLVAQAFPIWDLEDLPEVSYMLEEDVETAEFTPLVDAKTLKTWHFKQTGTRRPRYSDRDVLRVSADEEMLHRVQEFLADGLNLANDEERAPIHLRGTRIFFGSEDNIDALVVRPYIPEPIAPPKSHPVAQKSKPVSYAAAAANGHARQARPGPPSTVPTKTPSRDAQLSRMVDDLVDDEEGNNPVTPPQRLTSDPAVVSNGEAPFILHDSVHDLVPPSSKVAPQPNAAIARPIGTRPTTIMTPPPGMRSAGVSRPVGSPHDRLNSVSKLWNGEQSSPFPSGLPVGTMGTSPMVGANGHSRVNSASSIRSRNSLSAWGPTEAAPRTVPEGLSNGVYGNHSALDQTGMASPLLFGAGGGLWSTRGLRNISPPHGQG